MTTPQTPPPAAYSALADEEAQRREAMKDLSFRAIGICTNTLADEPQARSVYLNPFVLPDGRIVEVRCSRNKNGGMSTTIRVYPR